MIHLLAIGCDYKGESYELPDCELDAANVTSKANRFVGDSVSLRGRQVSISSLIDEVHTIADRKAWANLRILSFNRKWQRRTR